MKNTDQYIPCAVRIPYDNPLHEVFFENDIYESGLPWFIEEFNREPGMNNRTQVALHWHSGLEVIVPVNNGVLYRLEDHDGLIDEGDFLLVNCNEIHASRVQDRSRSYHGYCIKINHDYMQSRIPGFENIRFAVMESRRSIIRSHLENMLRAWHKNDLLRIQNALDQMLIELVDHHLDHRDFVHHSENSLYLCIRYLNAHYNERFDTERVSKALHLSYPYLARTFKAHTGKTMHEYINEIRCKKAEELLRSDMQVEDISELIGFPNVRAFTSAFTEIHGISPAKYRRENNI